MSTCLTSNNFAGKHICQAAARVTGIINWTDCCIWGMPSVLAFLVGNFVKGHQLLMLVKFYCDEGETSGISIRRTSEGKDLKGKETLWLWFLKHLTKNIISSTWPHLPQQTTYEIRHIWESILKRNHEFTESALLLVFWVPILHLKNNWRSVRKKAKALGPFRQA